MTHQQWNWLDYAFWSLPVKILSFHPCRKPGCSLHRNHPAWWTGWCCCWCHYRAWVLMERELQAWGSCPAASPQTGNLDPEPNQSEQLLKGSLTSCSASSEWNKIYWHLDHQQHQAAQCAHSTENTDPALTRAGSVQNTEQVQTFFNTVRKQIIKEDVSIHLKIYLLIIQRLIWSNWSFIFIFYFNVWIFERVLWDLITLLLWISMFVIITSRNNKKWW